MFTLIKREIEENRVFFIGTLILAVIFGVLFVWQLYHSGETTGDSFIAVLVWNSIIGMLIFCAMGAGQMYWDRMRKTSALLVTLAVTRNQIFVARVIAGFLLVIIGLAPFAGVTIMVASTGIADTSHFARLFSFEVFMPIFLLGFACYCVGLQAGWTSDKVIPTLGALGLSCLLIPVVLIKGFGGEIYAILVLFIAACLMRAWHTFSSAAI